MPKSLYPSTSILINPVTEAFLVISLLIADVTVFPLKSLIPYSNIRQFPCVYISFTPAPPTEAHVISISLIFRSSYCINSGFEPLSLSLPSVSVPKYFEVIVNPFPPVFAVDFIVYPN